MSAITDKLTSLGLPENIISELQSKAWDALETELMQGWLKATLTKFGIDANILPDVDFKNTIEAVQELTGTDVDGDGKTGVSEAIENLSEAAKNTDIKQIEVFAEEKAPGLMTKIKEFFGL